MILLRRYYEDRTEGKWIFPDDSYTYNLELPDLDNEPFVSCIPEGVYKVCADKTGRHQWFRYQDVPNRSAIEIHEAHTVDHLEGCQAPCMELKNGKAYRSKEALLKFKEWFPEDDVCFIVSIREWNEDTDGEW